MKHTIFVIPVWYPQHTGCEIQGRRIALVLRKFFDTSGVKDVLPIQGFR